MERSLQPNEKPGVGEGATSLLPSVSKVWGRAPESQAVPPHPPHWPAHHLTAPGELGLPQEEALHRPDTLPPQLPGPVTGTPPSTPTPMAVKTGPTTRVFPTRFNLVDLQFHLSVVHWPSPSVAGREWPPGSTRGDPQGPLGTSPPPPHWGGAKGWWLS